jgi:hypothetical protein
MAALFGAIRDWTIAYIPGGADDLDQLICVALGFRVAVGKTLSGSMEPTAGGASALISQFTPYSAALDVAYC